MKLLFLDVDGVLNSHEPLCPHAMCGQIHDDKAALLKEVLLATGAKIVLSSAWRYLVHRGEMNLAGINWLFRSHGLPNCIVGITREDTMQREHWDGSQPWPLNNERGQQIHDWRNERGHNGPYVVVDDLDLGITEAGHPFVKTDGTIGLTVANAKTLEYFLRDGKQ